jgi:ABC-2 type transport system permease protein
VTALQRVWQIAWKETLELLRKAGVVAFVLAIPIAEMIVLGYATAGGIEDLPAAVYDGDRSATSRRLIQAVHQSSGFEVTTLTDDVAQGERMLDEGRISAFFVIPERFERGLSNQSGDANVAAVVDGSNTAVANYTATYAEGVIGRFAAQAAGAHGDTSLISAEPRIWYNQELRREDFYIPALLGTMLSLVTLAITAVCIVRERERGTLEQLMVTPVRSLELIGGKLVPIIIIAYAELIAMLFITVKVFGVQIRGSLTLYIGLMFVYLMAELGVGIFISSLSNTQAQALPTIFLLVTVSSILAGFITPVEMMPPIAQRISALIPLRYFVTITRMLFAKGAGFQELAPQLIPLIGMGVVLFAASVWVLRRRMV